MTSCLGPWRMPAAPARSGSESHYVLLIETVGGSGGIALWTGEDLKRYPFLGAA